MEITFFLREVTQARIEHKAPPLSKRTVRVHRQDVAHQYKQVYYSTDMTDESRKDYKTFQPIIQRLECTGRVISICTFPKNNHWEVLK